jgi:hypothetical protein
MEEASGLCNILIEATKALAQAMPRLRNFGDIRHWTVEVNRLENDGDMSMDVDEDDSEA